MKELDRSDSPRSRVLRDLVQAVRVHTLDETVLGRMRRTGTVFQRSEWASPILASQMPFSNVLNTKQIRGVLSNDISVEKSYYFSPTRGSAEDDAQAIVELLNNIDNPRYSKPGSILRMRSPTFERLCQYKVDWHTDGVLGVSQIAMAVMPADDVQDLEYYDNYTISSLLTGSKVWLAYPPVSDNLNSLQAEYRAKSLDDDRFAMDNSNNFQHGIVIVQQAGQTLMLPPFWTAASISTQTSVSCAYHVATACVFPERIKHLDEFLTTTCLWPFGNPNGQYVIVAFATELIEHLQVILVDKFPQYNAGKTIADVCRAYESLQSGLRSILDAMEDKAVVRGLENEYRAAWLKILEQKRKKTSACRLCHVRIQNMPTGGTPTDRLRQHFVDFHCLRSIGAKR